MSDGGASPGGALGIGGFDFDDTSMVPRCARNHGLPSVGCGNGTIGSGAVRLRETPWALMGSLGCSPSALVEVRAMRAVLTARLRLLQRLVMLERMC